MNDDEVKQWLSDEERATWGEGAPRWSNEYRLLRSLAETRKVVADLDRPVPAGECSLCRDLDVPDGVEYGHNRGCPVLDVLAIRNAARPR